MDAAFLHSLQSSYGTSPSPMKNTTVASSRSRGTGRRGNGCQAQSSGRCIHSPSPRKRDYAFYVGTPPPISASGTQRRRTADSLPAQLPTEEPFGNDEGVTLQSPLVSHAHPHNAPGGETPPRNSLLSQVGSAAAESAAVYSVPERQSSRPVHRGPFVLPPSGGRRRDSDDDSEDDAQELQLSPEGSECKGAAPMKRGQGEARIDHHVLPNDHLQPAPVLSSEVRPNDISQASVDRGNKMHRTVEDEGGVAVHHVTSGLDLLVDSDDDEKSEAARSASTRRAERAPSQGRQPHKKTSAAAHHSAPRATTSPSAAAHLAAVRASWYRRTCLSTEAADAKPEAATRCKPHPTTTTTTLVITTDESCKQSWTARLAAAREVLLSGEDEDLDRCTRHQHAAVVGGRRQPGLSGMVAAAPTRRNTNKVSAMSLSTNDVVAVAARLPSGNTNPPITTSSWRRRPAKKGSTARSTVGAVVGDDHTGEEWLAWPQQPLFRFREDSTNDTAAVAAGAGGGRKGAPPPPPPPHQTRSASALPERKAVETLSKKHSGHKFSRKVGVPDTPEAHNLAHVRSSQQHRRETMLAYADSNRIRALHWQQKNDDRRCGGARASTSSLKAPHHHQGGIHPAAVAPTVMQEEQQQQHDNRSSSSRSHHYDPMGQTNHNINISNNDGGGGGYTKEQWTVVKRFVSGYSHGY